MLLLVVNDGDLTTHGENAVADSRAKINAIAESFILLLLLIKLDILGMMSLWLNQF